MAIAVDSAEDITPSNWNKMLAFVNNFVNRFPNVSPRLDGTRFGVVSYAAKPAVHFNFKAINANKNSVIQRIQRTPRQTGKERRMDDAMKLVETDLFSSKGGARFGAGRVQCHFHSSPLLSLFFCSSFFFFLIFSLYYGLFFLSSFIFSFLPPFAFAFFLEIYRNNLKTDFPFRSF